MKRDDVETVPVMANINPWNEAILRGARTFKTLHFNWSYRGPLVLYNSKAKTDEDAAVAYEIFDSQPHGVCVGMVDVVDCTPHPLDGFRVHLKNPRRLDSPIPYTPTRGSVRISRGPRSLFGLTSGGGR